MKRVPEIKTGDYVIYKVVNENDVVIEYEVEYKGEVIGSYPSLDAAKTAMNEHNPEPPRSSMGM